MTLSARPVMNLTGLHLLLTYRCNYECDHCFVWGGPHATERVMTLDEIHTILLQAMRLRTIEIIYFEGGEPFLHHPILSRAISQATILGFRTGVVSNAYWATEVRDAEVWLLPLAHAGLDILELSNDDFHGDGEAARRAEIANTAAQQIGLSAEVLDVQAAGSDADAGPDGSSPGEAKGTPVMYRGRAAATLVDSAPGHSWQAFSECPYENLAAPKRVHVDPFGYVHLCQGIVIGNLFEQPLSDLVDAYDPASHPIVAPLLECGPTGLAARYDLSQDQDYADACHLCYAARLQLRSQFPDTLTPGQMYGEMPGEEAWRYNAESA